jgi:hypothetical protein
MDRSDLTMEQDEGAGVGPRIGFLDRMDEDEEHPASEPSTSRITIGITADRDKHKLTGECS